MSQALESCFVCLEDCTDSVAGPCGHKMCRRCAVNCISRKKECPYCRRPLTVLELIEEKAFTPRKTVIPVLPLKMLEAPSKNEGSLDAHQSHIDEARRNASFSSEDPWSIIWSSLEQRVIQTGDFPGQSSASSVEDRSLGSVGRSSSLFSSWSEDTSRQGSTYFEEDRLDSNALLSPHHGKPGLPPPSPRLPGARLRGFAPVHHSFPQTRRNSTQAHSVVMSRIAPMPVTPAASRDGPTAQYAAPSLRWVHPLVREQNVV